jgi:hypothetical protein
VSRESQNPESKVLLPFEQYGSQLQPVTRKTFNFWRCDVKLDQRFRMLIAMQNKGHALSRPGITF